MGINFLNENEYKQCECGSKYFKEEEIFTLREIKCGLDNNRVQIIKDNPKVKIRCIKCNKEYIL